MNTVLPITYTPDFVINNNIIVECKGFSDQKFPLKWKMFKKQMIEKFSNNVYIFLIKNKKQAIECLNIIKNLLIQEKKITFCNLLNLYFFFYKFTHKFIIYIII